MGRYINWADAVGRYSQLSKIGGAEAVGSDFIQYAEAEVDARLSPMYTVPFSEGAYTPMTVKDLTIDMTYLKATFGKEKNWERMDKAMSNRFSAILKGDLAVILPDGTVLASVGGTVWGSNTGYTPIFGMGDTRDFEVDPDRVDTEDDARD